MSESVSRLPSRQPTNTLSALPRLAKILELLISSCSGLRSGGLAPGGAPEIVVRILRANNSPNLSASDSTYQADPIPRRSEIVFPRAAAAIVDIPNFIPVREDRERVRSDETGKRDRERERLPIITKCDINVLSGHDHDQVVKEPETNKGQRVMVSQLF